MMRIRLPHVAAVAVGAAGVASGIGALRQGEPDKTDPTRRRIHVLRKPIHPAMLSFGAIAGGGAAYGAAKLTAYMSAGRLVPSSGVLAAIVGGGVVSGAALASFGDGPKVGTVKGERSYFVKTGEEAYNTTCTRTYSDGNGTHTHTYPCTKVRDVGYTEWTSAVGELNLGRRVGDRGGYASLEAAIADVKKPGTRAALGFVERDGRTFAYRLDPDGPEVKHSVQPSHGSIVGYTDLDDTLHIGPRK